MRKEYDFSKLKSYRNPYAKLLKEKFSAEEKAIIKAIERNEFIPVKGAQLKQVAKAVAAKKKTIRAQQVVAKLVP